MLRKTVGFFWVSTITTGIPALTSIEVTIKQLRLIPYDCKNDRNFQIGRVQASKAFNKKTYMKRLFARLCAQLKHTGDVE